MIEVTTNGLIKLIVITVSAGSIVLMTADQLI